ncbi:hypothetical protein [Leptolyngbya sp. 7M]|uniref:hypothetical protein n=1 Tax=Leptolyngbya sp. 7M TaxID=2812896 RepID=UPI001B8BE29D|nr:hypothetical protein [Leptolyngbya sp. 7M]QYO64984.1 hypothetical protein JVX88_36590 [Leptolyngbya sp. 7M]
MQDFLAQANVTPEEGQLSKPYQQGIQLMAQQCYRTALQKFQEVENLNPQFPYIQQLFSSNF